MVRRAPERNVETKHRRLHRSRFPHFRFSQTLLDRPRIEQEFRRAQRHRLTVVHGPSGIGKSTAIDDHVRALTRPIATYVPDAREPELLPFARGLSDELAGLFPTLTLGLFAAAQSAARTTRPAVTLGHWFAARLASCTATIVLDDLHLIDDCDEIAEFVATVIEQSAPEVQWILGMRSTLSLPLSNWLAADMVDLHIDEHLLNFTADEAAALGVRLQIGKSEALRVLEVAGPQAEHFALALRSGDSGQTRVVSLEDRRATLLSEFSRCLSKERLCTLYAILQLPSLETELITHIPLGSELLMALDSGLPWAFRMPDRPRFASAFRVLLQDACPIPDGILSDATHLAVIALEHAGRNPEALCVAALGRSSGDVRRILDVSGFELMNRGHGDAVKFAGRTLSRSDCRLSSVALALEAMRESDCGRHDVADAWFSHAIQSAADPLTKARVQFLYAKDLLRRDRLDCIETLERLAQEADPELHASALAALGAAYGKAQRLADSRAQTEAAIRRIDQIADISARAMVYQNAAFTASLEHDAAAIERYGGAALSLAIEHGRDEIAVCALSALCYSAFNLRDDVESALRHVGMLESKASLLGNAFYRRYASLVLIDIHTSRGDWREVARAENALASEERENDDLYADEALLPARALRLACGGDFAAAYRVLDGTAARQLTITIGARWADIGLYAAVAGLWDAAREAIREAGAQLRPFSDVKGSTVVRAGLNLALASLVIGKARTAGQILRDLKRSSAQFPRLRCYCALLEAIVHHHNGARNHEEILGRLDELGRSGLGGVAAMIEAIPSARLELRQAS